MMQAGDLRNSYDLAAIRNGPCLGHILGRGIRPRLVIVLQLTTWRPHQIPKLSQVEAGLQATGVGNLPMVSATRQQMWATAYAEMGL